MPGKQRNIKTDRRRRRGEPSRDSKCVRLAKAAMRLGTEVKLVATRYEVRINGEPAGTVSATSQRSLKAFKRGIVECMVAGGGLHKLTRWHLLDLTNELGMDKNKCEQMTKADLVQALRDKGLNL